MKRVIIFGGSGGLGSQVAKLLEQKEYEVMVLSSKDCDIKNPASSYVLMQEKQYDIVLNMAGVNKDSFMHKSDLKDQHNQLEVNVQGAINIATACLPGMRERKYGRIIYISSVLATHNVLGTGIYSSCKAFVDRLVKSISAENISKGITCNSIQLGYFDGGMTYKLPDPEKFKAMIPLQRWGRIDELVNAIEFLINTEYCTGINLPLTGGV